jgi:hypothetical protein
MSARSGVPYVTIKHGDNLQATAEGFDVATQGDQFDLVSVLDVRHVGLGSAMARVSSCFGMANRLSPDWWQGRAAAEPHAEAMALWQQATWEAEQLEDVAHELEREARQLEEQASDCWALVRIMGSEAHSWR